MENGLMKHSCTGVGIEEPWNRGTGRVSGGGLLHNLPHPDRLSNTGRQKINKNITALPLGQNMEEKISETE